MESDSRFDPFRRRDAAMRGYELVKTVVMSVLVVPRALWMVLWLALYMLLGRIASWGLPPHLQADVYRVWWRRTILSPGPFMCRLAMLGSLGCWVRVRGDPSRRTPDGRLASIIVSNHVAYIDILAYLSTTTDVAVGFVAKAAIFSLPLIGPTARVWRCISVDRAKAGRAAGPSVTDQLVQRSLESDANPIVVFPEGTTSSGDYLLKFKRGAFVPGTPVKMAVLRYPFQQFNPAFDSMTGPQHIFRFLTQFVNYCELEWLPVYVPNEAEKADPQLYANNVRAAMAKASGLELRDVDLQDKQDYLGIIRGSSKLD